MAGVVLLSRSTRPCESMHGHAQTFSEQVIESIIDDSRCGMSGVAFRTAQPIDGLSCFEGIVLISVREPYDQQRMDKNSPHR